MNGGEMFVAGAIAGVIAGITGFWAVLVLRDIRPIRRDRRNRLELPGDRVYRARGRR